MPTPVHATWYVYILQCADDSLYTGVTTDVLRRLREHNTDHRGAKYTRARRPVALVYKKRYTSRSKAQQQEFLIKRLSRPDKLRLIDKK